MTGKYLPFEQDGVTYNLYEMPSGFVIKGDLSFNGRDLTELPDLSDVIVEGDFDCHNNLLTSLKGAPKKVGGHFDCCYNRLTTLEGAPEEVGKSFGCHNNQLPTLEGAPKEIGGNFSCGFNRLTSLQGAPEEIGGNFSCGMNQLTSLQGAPEEVGGSFSCSDNQIDSLQGAPQKVGGDFSCSHNKLTSLQGAPQEVNGDFSCHSNPDLSSLFGLPKMPRDRKIYCDEKFLKKYDCKEADDNDGGIYYCFLIESRKYQGEFHADRIRQKKHQEDIEKRERAKEKTQAAFEAWLKQNGAGKNSLEK